MSTADLAAAARSGPAQLRQLFEQMDQSARDASPDKSFALLQKGKFVTAPKPETLGARP